MDKSDLGLTIGYLENQLRQFTNIPRNLDATFYHTGTYDGDVKEGRRLAGLIERLREEL